MEQNDIVRTFGEWKIRVSWQQEEEKWYFSVVDVVGALTEQPTPKRASTYWAVLKNRLKKEGWINQRLQSIKMRNELTD